MKLKGLILLLPGLLVFSGFFWSAKVPLSTFEDIDKEDHDVNGKPSHNALEEENKRLRLELEEVRTLRLELEKVRTELGSLKNDKNENNIQPVNVEAVDFTPFIKRSDAGSAKLKELLAMWKSNSKSEEEKLSVIPKATQLLEEIIQEKDYRNHKPNAGFVFVKTFKTGSSTIASILHTLVTAHHMVGPVTSRVHWTLDDSEKPFNITTNIPGRVGAPYDIWTNHVLLYKEKRLQKELVPSSHGRFFSILRDPATRTKSAQSYYKWGCYYPPEAYKTWEEAILALHEAAKQENIEDNFYPKVQPQVPCRQDHSIRQIMGVDVDEEIFAHAVQKAKSNQLYLMVMERLTESLILFKVLYDIHPLDVTFLPMKVANKNATSSSDSEKKEKRPPNPDAEKSNEIVRNWNPYDTQLHKFAYDHLDKLLETFFFNPSIAKQAADELDTLNEVIREVCSRIIDFSATTSTKIKQAMDYKGSRLGFWCMEKTMDQRPWNLWHLDRLEKNLNIPYYN
jgi:Galactose-3-O-sulfotransferase